MPKYDKEVVEIECELKHETDAAYLIVTGYDKETWVPKSIGVWNPKKNSIDGTIDVPTWFADKHELE